MRVCLDPGHGGTDSGGCGNGLKEKDLVLEIGLKTRDILVAAGFEVLMTRSTDVFIGITPRWTMAANWGADLFISIHTDACNEKAANGFEVLWYRDYSKNTIGELMKSEMEKIGRWNRWIYGDYVGVLVHARMPAILTENLFVTNEVDAAKLSNPDYRTRIAQAHANAVFKYFGVQPEEDDEMPEFRKVTTKKALFDGKEQDVDVYGCLSRKKNPTLYFDRDVSPDTKINVYIKPFSGDKDDEMYVAGGYDNGDNTHGVAYPLKELFGHDVEPGWVYIHVLTGTTLGIGGLD